MLLQKTPSCLSQGYKLTRNRYQSRGKNRFHNSILSSLFNSTSLRAINICNRQFLVSSSLFRRSTKQPTHSSGRIRSLFVAVRPSANPYCPKVLARRPDAMYEVCKLTVRARLRYRPGRDHHAQDSLPRAMLLIFGLGLCCVVYQWYTFRQVSVVIMLMMVSEIFPLSTVL